MLNVVKLKTVCSNLKELSDLVKKEVEKNAKFDMSNAKVNDLENKINGATNLIHINQQNTDKQNLDQKIEDGDKKSRRQWFSD